MFQLMLRLDVATKIYMIERLVLDTFDNIVFMDLNLQTSMRI
jgi:hypothetical protein